jgi:CubicO group peptidase (beta-lactamase class C family)
MNKRRFIFSTIGAVGSALPLLGLAQDRWGEAKGYPTGWGAGQRQQWEGNSEYYVGNFSGGMEGMLDHHFIRASENPLIFKDAKRKIKFNVFSDASDFASKHNISALMIIRGNEVWHEEYRFQRNANMRFFGWSMTKSIVGLLIGIAVDQGKITSIDDRVDKYVPQLVDHPFGGIALRNFLNMTSGINICEAFCAPSNGFERYGYSQIGYSPRRGKGTDQIKGIIDFKWGVSDPQGQRFNYTDVNAVIVAWVLESIYKMPLAGITEKNLWQPMGAVADATWLTDSKGFTLSGAGVSAVLQDWAKIGVLVANDGILNGRQIISKSWLDEISKHSVNDQAVRFNVARPNRGYKNFFWHHKSDGSVLRMAGNFSQNILIDRKSKTVLVQMAVGGESGVDEMMSALFAAACNA